MSQWLKKILHEARFGNDTKSTYDGGGTDDGGLSLGGGIYNGQSILFGRPRVKNVHKKNRKQNRRHRGLQPNI